jgi:hypothetical protein
MGLDKPLSPKTDVGTLSVLNSIPPHQEKLEAWLGYHFVTGFTHAILFLDDASDEESAVIATAVAATHGAQERATFIGNIFARF